VGEHQGHSISTSAPNFLSSELPFLLHAKEACPRPLLSHPVGQANHPDAANTPSLEHMQHNPHAPVALTRALQGCSKLIPLSFEGLPSICSPCLPSSQKVLCWVYQGKLAGHISCWHQSWNDSYPPGLHKGPGQPVQL
jgi:hypothetical protein